MHGKLAEIGAYAEALRQAPGHVDLLICPPFTLLDRFNAALAGSTVALGGQDCAPCPQGAHTGDVSAAMLSEVGAQYVILGHSERREDHGETNADVAAKVAAAVAAGLTPIVCVGETEAQRDAGEAKTVVRSQLIHSLPEDFTGVVAYEPIWAIGTGRTPTEADVAAMHAAIRAALGRKSSTAARSNPATRPPCSRCRKSAAPWSAAPAWRRLICWPLLPARPAARSRATVSSRFP